MHGPAGVLSVSLAYHTETSQATQIFIFRCLYGGMFSSSGSRDRSQCRSELTMCCTYVPTMRKLSDTTRSNGMQLSYSGDERYKYRTYGGTSVLRTVPYCIHLPTLSKTSQGPIQLTPIRPSRKAQGPAARSACHSCLASPNVFSHTVPCATGQSAGWMVPYGYDPFGERKIASEHEHMKDSH
jgi:hypothetical protein